MSTTTAAYIEPTDHEFDTFIDVRCPCGNELWRESELCRECFDRWFNAPFKLPRGGRFDYSDNPSGLCRRCGHLPGNCGCGGR